VSALRDARLPQPDGGNRAGEPGASSGDLWSLLDRLPRSFLVLEVLSPSDERVPGRTLAAMLRGALPPDAAMDLGALCEAAYRTGEGQTAAASGLVLHIAPIVRDRQATGLVAVGARGGAETTAAPTEIDLLAASGAALRRTLEQDLGATEPGEDRARARRLMAVLRFLSYLREVESERELFGVVGQAAAVWYDVDAFAFRRTAAGKYVLDVTLPSAPAGARHELPPGIAARLGDAPLLLSSISELEALGWHEPPGEVLLLPVGTNGRPSWVLGIAGPITDECQTTLGAVRTVLASAMQRLVQRRGGEVEERLREAFREAGASPDGVFPGLLRTIIDSVGAGSARLVMDSPEGEMVLGDMGTPAEAGAAREVYEVALPLARGALRLRIEAAAGGSFSPLAMAVTDKAAAVILNWLV
jgi:hypothetical protein